MIRTKILPSDEKKRQFVGFGAVLDRICFAFFEVDDPGELRTEQLLDVILGQRHRLEDRRVSVVQQADREGDLLLLDEQFDGVERVQGGERHAPSEQIRAAHLVPGPDALDRVGDREQKVQIDQVDRFAGGHREGQADQHVERQIQVVLVKVDVLGDPIAGAVHDFDLDRSIGRVGLIHFVRSRSLSYFFRQKSNAPDDL